MALQNCSIWNMKTYLGETYFIPDYQREYSWEADELGDFWDDLIATKKDPDMAPHFFGQVVVHHDEQAKYIIDGQQRTITSVIFLRALQTFYKGILDNTGNMDADERNSDITSQFIGRYNSKGNKLHLRLNVLDEEYFRQNIQLGTPNTKNKEKKKSHERMRKAFLFFIGKIQESIDALGECDDEDRVDCLDEYYDAFTTRFTILYMEATKLEEAFVIFETLNARGKDLETSDLLKNYIFSQSKDVTQSQKKWNSMVNSLDKVDPTKYIRHFWNSNHEFTRDKALYRTISKEISTPKRSKDLLNDLEKFAPYYHAMAVPGEDMVFQNEKLLEGLRYLKTLKAKSFYPVVLSMAQAEFDEEEIAVVVKKIETYMFRNFTVCGKVANQSERFFAALAKDIYDGTVESIDEICEQIKSEIVSDEEFTSAFSVWNASKSEKEIVRYILTGIHKYLDTTLEINLDTSEVHIEHIMPVTISSQWDVSEDDHDTYLWRLGNLMLLSGPINSSISNGPFEEKKKRYVESKIEPNKDVAQYPTWGIEEIKQRQVDLGNYALKIWSR
ncbi:MAG: DUF262 domain-containing protein [Clostridiales bacterium]|nr:DUF262 domain-containing protein [Candidatus Cacconaster stercorequi]